MKINCLIIDDEPLARQHIESYVNRIGYLKLVGSVRDPAIGKVILENEPVDLIFLDIHMPQMNGIEFIKECVLFQQVILITAFPEYALDGFEVEAVDYLMKPVMFERFLKAVEKVKARLSGSESVRSLTNQPGFLYVKCNLRYEKILLDDILYIESMLNYINIITEKNRYTVYSSLKRAEISLPKHLFMKIHKSYIVSLSKITTIEPQQVHIGQEIIPVSRSNRELLIASTTESGITFKN